MVAPVVVILAAGQGTRMRSRIPKLLHPICGREMIWWPVTAARTAGVSKIVVVETPEQPLREHLADDIVTAIQSEPLGTAHALQAAGTHLDTDGTVIVLNGDVPLITPETIAELAEIREGTGAGATIVTAVLEDASGYGRVVRAADGTVTKVVETKRPEDATPEEREIREINAGIYAFDGSVLRDVLERVKNDNAQGEFYLPDALSILREDGRDVTALRLPNPVETLGVNDRIQLAEVRRLAQTRIHHAHMLAGATIVDPDNTVIDTEVVLGEDTVIQPGTALHGETTVGDGSVVGPHTTLIDVVVGKDTKVIHSYATSARIGSRVDVGPFSYLRPGTVLRDGSKAGAFVEIKNSDVGEGSKVPHLSYIGDTDIGPGANLGASTITANYDGVNKWRTTIGARVHTSVDTTFVAPVTIGDDAYTGAGSVITKDVPPGALGIARARQTNIEGYTARKKGED